MNYYLGVISLFIVIITIYIFYPKDLQLQLSEDSLAKYILLNETPRMSCSQISTPCYTNSDCAFLCTEIKFTICNEYVCDEIQKPSIEPPPITCNSNHGIIPVLVGYNSLGTAQWECKSIFLNQIFDDSDKLKVSMCEDGKLNINLNKKVFDYTDCECQEDSARFIFDLFNPYVASIPHCATKSEIPLLLEVKYV